MSGQDLINEGVSLGSNLGRRNKNEWPRSNQVGQRGGAMAECGNGAISDEVWVLGPRCMALDGD
jgi:hypothetical protein